MPRITSLERSRKAHERLSERAYKNNKTHVALYHQKVIKKQKESNRVLNEVEKKVIFEDNKKWWFGKRPHLQDSRSPHEVDLAKRKIDGKNYKRFELVPDLPF